MTVDVFIYELEELGQHKAHLEDVLKGPSFEEMNTENFPVPDYDLENLEAIYRHESDGDLYLDDRGEELRIYDPEGIVKDEFDGLLDACSSWQTLEN